MRILVRESTDFISTAKRRLDAIDGDHTVAVVGAGIALFSIVGAIAALVYYISSTGTDMNRSLVEMSGVDLFAGLALSGVGFAGVALAISLLALGRAANALGEIGPDAEAMIYLAAEEHLTIERPRGERR